MSPLTLRRVTASTLFGLLITYSLYKTALMVVCDGGELAGKWRRGIALFFKGSEFLDERYAVLTDACDAQTYSEFDLGSGLTRPGAIGDPGPLY